MNDAQDPIPALAEMIRAASNVVVFTGAGISTESGIPDFRGPQGVWTKGGKSIDFGDFISSEEVRRDSWRSRLAGNSMGDKEPNEGHKAVAQLVQAGKVTCIITQNVDGLHHKSGVAEEQIVELHGNVTYAKCLECDKRYEMDEVRAMFEPDETVPMCTECGGIIKSATISFGQSMPVDAMQKAEAATLACDLFLVLGSSLVVYPAAAFPMVARQNGAGLVIINDQETDVDPHCDLVIHQKIGATMSAVIEILNQES